MPPGEYDFYIQAVDQSGNLAPDEIVFTWWLPASSEQTPQTKKKERKRYNFTDHSLHQFRPDSKGE